MIKEVEVDDINKWLYGTDLVSKAIDRCRPSGGTEDEKNTSLANSLERKGIDARPARRGADIIGKDFVVEGKSSLTSKSDLARLKGQIDDYVNVGKKQRVVVVIYGDAKRSLLDDLRRYCAQFGLFSSVEVKVKGCVVGDVPIREEGSPMVDSNPFEVSDIQRQIRDVLS